MATPFEERAAAAVANPKFRLADFKPLIDEGAALSAQLRHDQDAAEADSTDFHLSADERDSAARQVDHLKRRLVTIAGAIAALESTFSERRSAEKARKAEAERKAAREERDDLAKRWEAVKPSIDALLELLAATEANDRRLAAAGLNRLPSAELVGRGNETGHIGIAPLARFSAMKVPNWSGLGYAWPKGATSARRDVYDPDRAARQLAAKQAQDRAIWGKYRVSLPEGSGEGARFPFQTKQPAPLNYRPFVLRVETSPWEGRLDHSEAERLRGLGVVVEAVDDPTFEEDRIYYANPPLRADA